MKDQYDTNVLAYISAQVAAGLTIGADDATAGSLADIDGGASEAVNIDTSATDSSDPLDVLARAARLLDDNNVLKQPMVCSNS